MTFTRRAHIAIGLMSVGLVALVVDSVANGWTTLGVVSVACLVLAIGAELVALRQHQLS
jgi:membrane-bound ClpP family serine protease